MLLGQCREQFVKTFTAAISLENLFNEKLFCICKIEYCLYRKDFFLYVFRCAVLQFQWFLANQTFCVFFLRVILVSGLYVQYSTPHSSEPATTLIIIVL